MKSILLSRDLRRRAAPVIGACSLLWISAGLLFHDGGSAVAGGSSLVRGVPSDARRIQLAGHLLPSAQRGSDEGPVPDSLPMVELKLILKRSAAQDAALEQLLDAQQTPGSAQYHKWLTPAQFGTQFGPSDQDLHAAAVWLESHSFKVGDIPAGRLVLPFSGTAAQVEAAFQTPIHYFNVDGVEHFANTVNPQIPASFEPLVSGIRGLHDFRARSNLTSRVVDATDLSTGGGNYVTPFDFGTIYNGATLYQHGVTGAGVTVVIAAQSDIDPTIPKNYWAAFGVSHGQNLSSVATAAATDPGRTGGGNESEAYLDVEIAGAVAPAANIILVRDKDVGTAFSWAIDQNLGAVISVSFSNCEKKLGSANANINASMQQAVAQGITVLVSAGDSGSSECDDPTSTAGATVSGGLSVNGLGSSPYDTVVGGTDFNPVLVKQGNYWGSSNAAGTYSNANSYIPEMVWNLTCTNPVTVSVDGAASAEDLCNNSNYGSLDRISAGGGGVSSCITVTTSGVCSAGYAAPSWQTGVVGIQGFTTRAIPDVAMLANKWVGCDQTATTCGGTKSLEIFGGTSAAAPAMAGLVTLLDEVLITKSNTDGRMGNLNPTLYRLGASEYGSVASPKAANLTNCNANNGANIGDSCIFYDLTTGTNAQPCKVSTYAASNSRPLSTCASGSRSTYGIVGLVTSTSVAYNAAPGYDLASGLGSVNFGYFVEAIAGLQAPSNLIASGSGTTVTLSWTGFAQAVSFNVYQGTAPNTESSTPVQTGIAGTATTISGLQAGQTYYFYVTANTAAGMTYPSEEESATLVPATVTGLTTTGTATDITLTWSASEGASTYEVFVGSTAGGESSTPVATGVTGTSFSMAGTTGTAVYFKVLAVNDGGTSALSSEAVGNVLPASATGLIATGGSASVNLKWTAATGATGYNVYEGTAMGSESSTAVMSNVSGTSVTLNGLQASTTYYFYVRSVNSAGASAPSNEASATTSAASSGKSGGGSIRLIDLLLGTLLVLGRYALSSVRSRRLCGSTRTETRYVFRFRRSSFR